MVEQSKLLKQAEQLKAMMHDWIPKRKNTVHTLRVLADKLMVHHNNVCIAKVAGSSTAVAGFVLAAVGFGLSFVTFGTSLILAGVGVGVGAAGGVTNAGSMIAEARIQRDTFDAAQKIIDDDREAHEGIKKLLKEFGNEAQKSTLSNGVKAGLTSAFIVKNCVETGLKVGARVASTAASEGGEALFRGLSVAGRVFHIGGFAFSAVLLPVDIYTLVTNSMEIDASRKGKKDKEPKAVKKLKELADELEKNMPNENDFIRELDDFILNATMNST
ncbi:uncharacterized protein LOC144632317 [Oculina patagonica]